MKRVLVLALLVLLVTGGLFATGAAEESGAGGAEPITLRFNQHGQDWVTLLRPIVEGYTDVKPNVTVEVSRLGGDDFWAALRTVIASGDVHDVFAVQAGSMLGDFVDAGHLEPLDGLSVLEHYSDPVEAIGTVDGTLWGIPPSSSAMGVVYNRDIFDELGLEPAATIGELEELVDELKAAGYTPFAGYYNDVWTLRHLFSLVHTPLVGDPIAFTEEMMSGERDTYRVDGIDRAMDVVDLMNENVQPRPFDATFGDATALMAQGETAMIIQGIWAVDNTASIDPDFNAGLFAVPVSDDPEDATLSVDSSVVWSVYSGGENVSEAKDFLNWLVSPDQMQTLGDESGSLMAFTGFQASGLIAPVNEAMQSYSGRGATHRWGFNKWPTGFDMDVVAPAMQEYMRTGDRDALFEEIDSQYPN